MGSRYDRATRFPVHVPLLFRPVGEAGWREGRTENISRSGVLFRADGLMDLDTPIEMGLVLLSQPEARPTPQVICFGSVVRAESSACGDAQPALAARIRDYRFVGGPAAR